MRLAWIRSSSGCAGRPSATKPAQTGHRGEPSAAGPQRADVSLDRVQQRQPITHRSVADVIDEAGVTVGVHEVFASTTRQNPQCHGEVLGRAWASARSARSSSTRRCSGDASAGEPRRITASSCPSLFRSNPMSLLPKLRCERRTTFRRRRSAADHRRCAAVAGRVGTDRGSVRCDRGVAAARRRNVTRCSRGISTPSCRACCTRSGSISSTRAPQGPTSTTRTAANTSTCSLASGYSLWGATIRSSARPFTT